MKDPRQAKLARIMVDYSTEVKKGDIVVLEYADGVPFEFVREIQTLCLQRRARHVRIRYTNSDLVYNFYRHASREQLAYFPRHELEFMKKVTVYIGIGSPLNSQTFAGIPAGVLTARQRLLRPIQERRVEHTRWVITRYPTHSQAQDAGMSFADFEDFYFRACNIDWKREARRQEKLKRLLERSETVRLLASDTDLTFSIKGMGAIKCAGKRNLPDGEVFTAPVKTSAEGYIRYNTPALFQGKIFSGIRFEVAKGRIVRAEAERGGEHLPSILDTDRGARYFGEFSFGLNRAIQRAMTSTLFDEKIAGSIHLTPGKAYGECDNGNRSAIHWDLVRIMTDGEIHLDGQPVQKKGKFVLPELKPLN